MGARANRRRCGPCNVRLLTTASFSASNLDAAGKLCSQLADSRIISLDLGCLWHQKHQERRASTNGIRHRLASRDPQR
jgi:hypothetical protein